MTKGLNRSNGRGGKRAAVLRLSFPIKNLTIPITDPGGAAGYGNVAASFRLPEGNILVHGVVAQLVISSADADVSATWGGNIAMGTTATVDSVLTGTDVNLVQSTVISAAVGKVSPLIRATSAIAQSGNILDNTSNTVVPYFNMSVLDADLAGAADFVINGNVDLIITVLGDD